MNVFNENRRDAFDTYMGEDRLRLWYWLSTRRFLGADFLQPTPYIHVRYPVGFFRDFFQIF